MKIRNLSGFEQYETGDKLLAPGDGVRVVSFDVNPVGPCVVYLYTKHPGVKEPTKTLACVVEKMETLDVTVEGDAWFQLEVSSEAWVRHKFKRVVNPNPGQGETFTRMEKMGLYADELSIALHRQAVVNRIVQHRESYAQDAYQRQLESRVESLAALVAKLTPKEEPEGETTGE